MKNQLLILILFIIPCSTFCQNDLETRLTQRVIGCSDIAKNSAELFIQYIQTHDLDSAAAVLDFWAKHCTMREPLLRAQILLSILSSELSEEIYDSTILDYVDTFIVRIRLSKEPNYKTIYEYHERYFGYIPLNSSFDTYTKEIAESITDFDNNLEMLFSLLLSEKIDEFYFTLQDSTYSKYRIRHEYDTRIQKLKKMRDKHFNISLGLTIPTSNAELLGIHPTFGVSSGIKHARITYNLSMDFRFGPTKETYQVIKISDTISSNYYFGAYIGFDGSFDIFRLKKNELLLLAGIGIDGFDTEFKSSNTDPIVSVFSPNFNTGLQYRWYYNGKNYLGIQYKYNIVNYNSKHIMNDLTGNFHSVAISFGSVYNHIKSEELEKLQYRGGL